MDRIGQLHDMHRILVLNPKGGSGKTTLATNLAAAYAERGARPTLIDCDEQGYALRWLEKRPPDKAPIHGIAAYEDPTTTLASLTHRAHPESRTAIADLPAAIPTGQLYTYTAVADSILIPIVPSQIDVYSASRFIAELLLDAQLDRREQKLAIVANRVRSHTRSYKMLQQFLASLSIPMIGTLRDTQTFVHAAGKGIGICELPPYQVRDDIVQIRAIVAWLEKWRSRRFEAFNPLPLAATESEEWMPSLSRFD